MKSLRISESELIIPALQIFSQREQGTTTSDLIKELTAIMRPIGKDAEILHNRNDSHFSQIVRNLRSHKTFERLRLAVYKVGKPDGKYFITTRGKIFLLAREKEFEYICNYNFTKNERKDAITALLAPTRKSFFIPETNVFEGAIRTTTVAVRARSTKLRKYAFQYYSKKGQIKCSICNFDFMQIYGKYGEKYIEFHHMKPISTYNPLGQISDIKNAIKNICPVCSNCHAIIHRNNITPQKLKKVLKKYERTNITNHSK